MDNNMIKLKDTNLNIGAKFREFVNDKSPEGYDKFEITATNEVLIRLFRIEEISSLLNPATGKAQRKYIAYPFAKIIKVGSNVKSYKVGDIACLDDGFENVYMNPNWIKWDTAMKNEKPTPDIPEPEKVMGKIIEWRQRYMFRLDKFNQPTNDDLFTFLIPESFLKIKYKGNELEATTKN